MQIGSAQANGESRSKMVNAVNNSRKQRGRPFRPGISGNRRGRPKGSRNKRTRALIEAARAGGEMPLDYMLRAMRDAKGKPKPKPKPKPKRRDAMAVAAAPYYHSKLSLLSFKTQPNRGQAKHRGNVTSGRGGQQRRGWAPNHRNPRQFRPAWHQWSRCPACRRREETAGAGFGRWGVRYGDLSGAGEAL
jgi:hypothetical protein